MNPDKLFDYLDGKLSASERARLEQQLVNDAELQRELAMARRIHGQMSGESREVLLEGEDDGSARGRHIVRRIAILFITLIGLNVGAGLWFIAHHESRNPNRKLLEAQARDQVSRSLDQAAKGSLSPAPVVDEITIAAAAGKLDAVADEVVAAARRLGGSATKELTDNHRTGVLADIAANREQEFRNTLAAIAGGLPVSSAPTTSPAGTPEKKSFVVRIVEPGATQP